MSNLLIFLSFCVLFGLYAMVIAAIQTWHRDQQWRQWLRREGGLIAPDGKDMRGRKINRSGKNFKRWPIDD